MLIVSLMLVAAAMTAVAATAVPLVRGRYQLPSARRVLVALIPLWQLAMMAMSLIAGAVRGVGIAWVPLCETIVAGVGFACAAFNPRLFAGIEQAGAQNVAAARAQALEEQVGVQQAYLEQAERAAVEAVRSRHVYADEFEHIAEALAAGDVPGALVAVERTDAIIPRSGGRLCQHPVADALLKAKMAQAEKEGTELVVHADVPYELELPDAELCAVLSNLINNAVAAAARVASASADRDTTSSERPQVTVAIGSTRGYLAVRVENPYPPEEDAMLRELAASRRTPYPTERAHDVPQHGWGLSIVRELTEAREGSLELEVADGRFRVVALLKLGA